MKIQAIGGDVVGTLDLDGQIFDLQALADEWQSQGVPVWTLQSTDPDVITDTVVGQPLGPATVGIVIQLLDLAGYDVTDIPHSNRCQTST